MFEEKIRLPANCGISKINIGRSGRQENVKIRVWSNRAGGTTRTLVVDTAELWDRIPRFDATILDPSAVAPSAQPYTIAVGGEWSDGRWGNSFVQIRDWPGDAVYHDSNTITVHLYTGPAEQFNTEVVLHLFSTVERYPLWDIRA